MKFNFTNFLVKNERLIPIILFLLFLLVTIPGISWGAPSLWNPDELVWRVNKALIGEMKFDETEPDYNYPSLPKHVMYGLGWLVKQAGGSIAAIIVSARLISVLLGGLTVLLIYSITKIAGANIYIRLLSAFFALSNIALAHNARFAHNDMYLLFFITLSLYAIIKYRIFGRRLWLYLAFFSAGCAASSKYTGASFIVILLVIFLVSNWKNLYSERLRTAETLFIATALTVAGFVLGTPKALIWMSFYFKRMVPAALRFASYGRGPDSTIGFYGQWGALKGAVGTAAYYLFLIAFLWSAGKLILYLVKKDREDRERMDIVLVILIAIILFDIPFMLSYNYVPRFFLPFLPMFAVLASLFVEDLVSMVKRRGYAFLTPLISTVVILVIGSSFMQVVSVALLFANDARTTAGKFLKTLEPGTLLEYTLYPPAIPANYFAGTRNYPIYLVKYPGETVPTNKPYRYNEGEEGLFERGANYLVADSFTYARFGNEFICETNPV
ncbi:MAG: phospholipid carrier-dependent glycosyltransferase, partial [Anaerolineae bacterium]|nr:phospholipid carrier-dependent glycosyltransferase [Anaerolineae bacterium]